MSLIKQLQKAISVIALVSIAPASALPEDLFYLGTVNGKSFYIEPEITMNWTSALAHCSKNDLHPAAILSVEETTLLVDTIHANNLSGRSIWTSGRQYLSPDALIWHDRADKPREDVLIHWRDRNTRLLEPYHFCLSFHVKEIIPKAWDFTVNLCEQNFSVLCEQ